MATKHNGWGGARPGAGRKPGSKTSPDKISYSEAHRRKEVALAQQRELELRRMSHELVEGAQVRAALGALGRQHRDAILLVPIQVAHAIAAESDPRKVEDILTKALRQVLEDVAKTTAAELQKLSPLQ